MFTREQLSLLDKNILVDLILAHQEQVLSLSKRVSEPVSYTHLTLPTSDLV